MKPLEIGSEPTPEAFIQTMVAVFREVRRVLHPSGTCWVNIGDSYNGYMANQRGTGLETDRQCSRPYIEPGAGLRSATIKPKDLCLIPERIALALQAPHEETLIKDREWRVWLAGILDAEGCMGIRKQECSGSKDRGWNATYIPYVSIGMSDPQVLEKCKSLTGFGTITVKHRAGYEDNRKVVSRRDHLCWRLDGDKAIRVLRDVWPWLMIKQAQAACICALDDSNKSARPGRHNGPVPQETLDAREQLYVTTKALNQRQAVGVPEWVNDPKPHVEPGWWVRSRIAWCKRSPMPESVTDRPTSAWEHVWLLTKSARYFYDAVAVRQTAVSGFNGSSFTSNYDKATKKGLGTVERIDNGQANLRNFWLLGPEPYREAHFATFPSEIPKRAILAGTSARGCCPKCLAPWERVVEKEFVRSQETNNKGGKWGSGGDASDRSRTDGRSERGVNETRTTGWRPTCECDAGDPIPCTVCDPFGGSGTTAAVALELGRKAILCELNPEYVKLIENRTNVTAGLQLA